MSTVREMSEEYLKTAYELCVFLRLHSHAALGERIMTTAVEVATLSHTTWAYYGTDGFVGNLVKTHEMADKLLHLINIVEYLDLKYSGFEKVKQDTEAIYKMSRSSINTLQKNQTKKDDAKEREEKRPTEQLKEQIVASEPEEKQPDKEEISESEDRETKPLPFEVNGEDEEQEESA